MLAAEVVLFGTARLQKDQLSENFLDDKRYRLLAYLAYQSDWVSREELAYLFWANTDSQSARKNLRHLIARTKNLDLLEGLETPLMHLRWLVQTDVALFRQAVANSAWAEALRHYSGAFLADFTTEDSPEYTAWLMAERQSLFELWRNSLMSQVNALHQQKESLKSLGLLETLLLADPLDEVAIETYMQIAAAAGQRQLALRGYHEFSLRLQHELGLSPPSHLEQLATSMQHAPEAASQSAVTVLERQKTLVLPTLVNAFVGREMLMAELSHLFNLRGQRLVTLLGMGGVGKTRMALQFAHEQQKNCDVTFVRLLPLEQTDQIPSAIAESLGLGFRGLESPILQIAQAIGTKKLLLVLDNFEQVSAGRNYVAQLLEQCPELMVLVTSRVALGLQSEQRLEVDAFIIPDHIKPDEAKSLEAVQLFVQQARRVASHFIVTPENLGLILEICRLVDGLALGIELAAVWVRSLDLEQIAAEISKNLDFLATVQPDRSSHHRSLRAVFESSWHMLVPAEQQAMRRLSVFKNGFSKDAMQKVTDVSVVVLSSLIDKSLVAFSRDLRYRRHRLVSAFMAEKLLENPEEASLARQKHAQHYFWVLRFGLEQIRNGDAKAALETLELELENIRSAWRWAIEVKHLYFIKTSCEALMRFFDARWRIQEGIDFFTEAIAVIDDPATLGTLFIHQAKCYQRIEQNELSQARTKEGLRLLERLEETETMIWGLGNLGTVASMSNQPKEAIAYRRQALGLAQKLGNERLIAVCLGWVAISEDILEDFEAAQKHYLEAIALFRGQHNQIGELFNLNSLAVMKLYQNDHQAALELLLTALELAEKTGELYQHFLIQINIGTCYQQLENFSQALVHTQKALTQSQQLNTPAYMQIDLHISLGQISKALGLPSKDLAQALEIAASSFQATPTLKVLLEFAQQTDLPANLVFQIASTIVLHPESQSSDRAIATKLLEQHGTKPTKSTELAVLIQQIRKFLRG